YGTADPIYDEEGKWSTERFKRWLVSVGICYWPHLESGKLKLDKEAFESMYRYHPGIVGLHALRDSLNFISNARLPIGRDGRNRPSLHPLGTATGRNAHSKSAFNAHAGLRSFILFDEGTFGCYLDFAAQEMAIAAARSGDAAMRHDYETGDPHHAM